MCVLFLFFRTTVQIINQTSPHFLKKKKKIRWKNFVRILVSQSLQHILIMCVCLCVFPTSMNGADDRISSSLKEFRIRRTVPRSVGSFVNWLLCSSFEADVNLDDLRLFLLMS